LGYKSRKILGVFVLKKSWLIDAGLIILIILSGVFLYNRLKEYQQSMQQEEPIAMDSTTQLSTEAVESTEEIAVNYSRQLGVPAPDFTLKNVDGEFVSLSDYLGTPVMINFWTTWCLSCTTEMPLIDEYAKVYADELVVLAVNAGEQKEDVRDFIEAEDFHMVFLMDPSNSVEAKYFVYGYPASIFIDDEGLLQAIHFGELDEDGLIGYLGKIGVGK
jgi:peroxiredoxin